VALAWLARYESNGNDSVQAIASVLFERLDEAQLNEFQRLLYAIRYQDGVTDLSGAMIYEAAVTAVFNLEET
jgi:hypothetical protein